MAEHTVYHKDGSIWAKGELVNDMAEGYWEWFRKPARPGGGADSKMRSGYFTAGKQTGEWITYAKDGRVVKVTNMDK